MTSFSQIYRLALNEISNDYRITEMFENNPTIAQDLLESWLFKGVALFQEFTEISLEESYDSTNATFTVDLSFNVIKILSQMVVMFWMEWNINNIVQMNLSLQDADYKRYSEERNLTGKVDYMNKYREIIYQDMTQMCLNQAFRTGLLG